MASESKLTSLARLGFAARGLTYILVGWFAIQAARSGSRPDDNREALQGLAGGGFGQALLAVVALGLVGYAIWRLTEAAFDPEQLGTDGKGLAKRAGSAISGIVHLGLAVFAARLAFAGTGGQSGDANADAGSAWLMTQPGGVWLVGIVGVLLLAGAAGNAYEAYKAKFAEDLGGDVPAPGYVKGAGRVGYAARGVVFALMGGFFINAALTADPDQAGGTGQALRALQGQSYGPWLLGAVALGLLLFGVFGLIQARYRRLRVVSPV